MPHFFMLENNSSDDEIKRTRQEARAITEYLVQTSTPNLPKYVMPDSIKGTDDRPINALLGAVNVLLRVAADRGPRAIVVCFGAEAASRS